MLVATVLAAPGTASAGRTFYGWLYGTEVMPERGAEIQTIVAEQNGQLTPASQDETDWWLEPAIGINDQLELLLPFEISWTAAYDESPRTFLDNFGAELRYRLVTSDLENKPAFVPLVRVAVKRIVVDVHGQYQPEIDLVSSYDVGRVQMLVDLGGIADIGGGQPFHAEFHPGAGVSVAVGRRRAVRRRGVRRDLARQQRRRLVGRRRAEHRVESRSLVAVGRVRHRHLSHPRRAQAQLGDRILRQVAVWTALAVHVAAAAPAGRVVGTVTITDPDGKPVDAEAIIYVVGFKEPPAPNTQPTQIAQKNRAFVPDLVAITVGETVAFPNRDPFLHNVFSQSAARKFDLGSFKKDDRRRRDFPTPASSTSTATSTPRWRRRSSSCRTARTRGATATAATRSPACRRAHGPCSRTRAA